MEKMYIQVERERIGNILSKLRKGVITIPRFQRDYVWNPKQVVDLFDSILKGWPIGSLLFWAPEVDKFKIFSEVGGININPVNASEQFYILDGRQRLTTLLGVLSQDGAFSRDYYVDLDEMKVVGVGKRKHELPINCILLSEAYDPFTLVDYLDRMRKVTNDNEKRLFYSGRAKEVNRMLINYELSYIEVHGGEIGDAVQIFSRLNDKSTPVSPDYMIQALSYSPNQDFRFADAITDIKDELYKFNMRSINRDIILRCAYNYSGKYFIDAKAEDLYKRNDLISLMDNVREDVLLAAKFLYHTCKIIDMRLLPYTYQFIMCAMFFKYNRKATEEQLLQLKRWFFYTTYTSYFTNTSLGVIRKDLYRFELFCKGKESAPMDYDLSIDLSDIPHTASLGAVRNCAFALSQLASRNVTEYSRFDTYLPIHINESSIDCAIICTNKEEKVKLSKLFTHKESWTEDIEKKFHITYSMMNLYWNGHYEEYRNKYKDAVHNIEAQFVSDILFDRKLSDLFL